MSYANETVVLTAPSIDANGWELLQSLGMRVITTPMTISAPDLAKVVADANPIAVLSRAAPLNSAAIASAPKLKVVSKYGVGYDNIDVDALTARSIPLYITRGANSQSVAELAIGLMISVARWIVVQDAEIRSGRWHRPNRGMELSGRLLGIVGFGAVGSRVAKIAAALGMEILVHDPLIPPASIPAPYRRAETLDALLCVADVLTIHCPLDGSTRNMIGADELARLKSSAIVINTGRGGIIEESALADALAQGRLFGAGIDTHALEPPRTDHPLYGLGNVIFTTHCGAGTGAAAERVSVAVVENMLRGLGSGDLDTPDLVNRRILTTAAA